MPPVNIYLNTARSEDIVFPLLSYIRYSEKSTDILIINVITSIIPVAIYLVEQLVVRVNIRQVAMVLLFSQQLNHVDPINILNKEVKLGGWIYSVIQMAKK